jgi:HK97 family phage prohead protease
MRDEFRSAAAPSLAPEFAEGARGERDKRAVVPTLVGWAAVFNKWSEINSAIEGRFLERLVPGSFARTLARDRAGIRALFEHGRDPQIGNRPLGTPTVLREDELGVGYEVPLLPTSYNADLEPGLRAGVYSASFRFQVQREQWRERPERSTFNPDRRAAVRPLVPPAGFEPALPA